MPVTGQAGGDLQAPVKIGREVIRTLPAPGLKCFDLTVDSIYLWVPDDVSRSIYRIDYQNHPNGEITLNVPYPEEMLFCHGITFDGKNVWICGWESPDGSGSRCYKLDRKTGAVKGSFDYPGEYDGNWPHGLTYAGTLLCADNMKTHTIDLIDPDSGELTGTLPAPTTGSTGLAWHGSSFWTSDPGTGMISKIDRLTGEVLGETALPAANCNGMEWSGEYLWTVSWETQTIYQMEVGILSLLENLPEDTFIYPNPSTGDCRLISSKEFPNDMQITVLDMTGRQVRRITPEIHAGGQSSVQLHLQGLPQGLYLIRLESPASRAFLRVVIRH